MGCVTLMLAERYMNHLGRGLDALAQIKLLDRKVMEFMQEFFPVTEDMTDLQKRNNQRLLDDKGGLTAAQRQRLVKALGTAAEVRGTDATGIAFLTST